MIIFTSSQTQIIQCSSLQHWKVILILQFARSTSHYAALSLQIQIIQLTDPKSKYVRTATGMLLVRHCSEFGVSIPSVPVVLNDGNSHYYTGVGKIFHTQTKFFAHGSAVQSSLTLCFKADQKSQCLQDCSTRWINMYSLTCWSSFSLTIYCT